MITRTKYNILIRNSGILTDKEIAEIKEFEAANQIKPIEAKTEFQKNYIKKLRQEPSEENFVVKYEVLLHKFKQKYKELEGVDYDESYIDNLKTVLYYFSNDERFFNCSNLSVLSKPSFEKGLLIVGNYGNGKTSTMKTLRSLFEHTPKSFKMFTTNRIVTRFEETDSTKERYDFMNRTKTGRAYFDDVKTEKEASNYGKHNLMKDIIEERYNAKLKTYITCNYVEDDASENLVNALHEFNTKYGSRVYDRLFAMFNIIEFKGKSKRK